MARSMSVRVIMSCAEIFTALFAVTESGGNGGLGSADKQETEFLHV